MSRIILPFEQYFDDAGNPLVNGELYFYEVGSTTPKDTYADAELAIPNANPVKLSGAGRQPNIYGSGTYRVTLNMEGGQQIEERDNVGSDSSDGYGSDWDSTIIYNVPDVVLYDGIYYQSLTNGNVGNNPETSPSEWVALGVFTVDDQAKLDSLQGEKNLIIDGDFKADQDGFGGGQPAAGVYGYDMWKGSPDGLQIEQIIKESRISSGDHVIAWDGGTGTATVNGAAGLVSGSVVNIAVSGDVSVIVPTDSTRIRLNSGTVDGGFNDLDTDDVLPLVYPYYETGENFVKTSVAAAASAINMTSAINFKRKKISIPALSSSFVVGTAGSSGSATNPTVSGCGLGVSSVTINEASGTITWRADSRL